MSDNKKINQGSFEQYMASLTQLVEQMEQGNLSLEQSLQHFEEGVKLLGSCQHALKTAEQKVQLLNEAQQLTDYDDNEK